MLDVVMTLLDKFSGKVGLVLPFDESRTNFRVELICEFLGVHFVLSNDNRVQFCSMHK
jgi:hypothetical protein